MAWQLIYTSAPRLLEAGRTGFGTVARHRAVSELVAGAVERVSQFARLPGLGARRLVFSHRLLTVSTPPMHLFSCIRDAGSDYTGRTHHLAHHLIAEDREVRAAAEAGITPADVLTQMKWRTAWTEPPRFLESSEEVSLLSLRCCALGSAWERLTGKAELAALLAQSPRCFVILPAEADALPLYQETLSTMGLAAAQVTFTTHLEPTDDPASFRWAALSSQSPLRAQADGVARRVLDLTQAQTWPSLDHSVPSASPPRRAIAQPLPMTEATSHSLAVGSSLPGPFLPPQTSAMPRAIKRGPLIAVGLLILLLSVYFLLSQPQPTTTTARSASDLAERIETLWDKHHLRLPITAGWLKSQADAALIASHEASLQQMAKLLRKPLLPLEVSRPESTQDEFMDLLHDLQHWHKAIHDSTQPNLWSSDDVSALLKRAREHVEAEARLWQSLKQHFVRPPTHPEILQQTILAQVSKRLAQSLPPPGQPEAWQELLTLLTASPPPWSARWVAFSQLPASPALLSKPQRQLLEDLSAEPSAPPWLRQQATQRLASIREQEQTLQEARQLAAKLPKPSLPHLEALPADGPSSSHPRFLLLPSAGEELNQALARLPALPVQPDMQIFAGPAGHAESNLLRWRQLGAEGVYRRSFAEAATLEIQEGRLIKAPADHDAWRIVARSKTGTEVLFEVLKLPRAGSTLEVWHAGDDYRFSIQSKDQRTTLDATAARWLATLAFANPAPYWRLQSLDKPTRRHRLLLKAGEAIVEAETRLHLVDATTARVRALTDEIEAFQQGIRGDEERMKIVTNGRLASREKAESLARLESAIASKQLRILQMEEERRRLTAVTPEPGDTELRPGRYLLSAVTFNPDGSETVYRLCQLSLTSQPAPSAP